MLRACLGILVAGFGLAGPASASSMLELPARDPGVGPSFIALGGDATATSAGVDPVVTSSHGEDEPRIIRASEFVAISASILAMVPVEPSSEGNDAAPDGHSALRGEPAPMVIRGGIVGDAFAPAAPGSSVAAQPEPAPAERASTSTQPSQAASPPGSRQPSPRPPSPRRTPAPQPALPPPAEPTGVPL